MDQHLVDGVFFGQQFVVSIFAMCAPAFFGACIIMSSSIHMEPGMFSNCHCKRAYRRRLVFNELQSVLNRRKFGS